MFPQTYPEVLAALRGEARRDLKMSRRAAAGRAQLLAKSTHAGHLRLPAELLEVAENSGNLHFGKFAAIL